MARAMLPRVDVLNLVGLAASHQLARPPIHHWVLNGFEWCLGGSHSTILSGVIEKSSASSWIFVEPRHARVGQVRARGMSYH